MHFAKQNFSNVRDDEKVIDQVVKWNSQFYNLDLDIKDTIIQRFVKEEGDRIEPKEHHVPHIKNLYHNNSICKLVAYQILSSRDNIQGGEFKFKHWGNPPRKDNFGKKVEDPNPYPVWLNEQGTLFIVPALETVSTQLIVSGKLEYVKYSFRGGNYK